MGIQLLPPSKKHVSTSSHGTCPVRPSEDHVISCISKHLNRRVGIIAQKGAQSGLATIQEVQAGEPALANSLHFTPIDENDRTNYLADFKTTHLGREVLIDVRYTATFHAAQAQRTMVNFHPEVPTVEMLNKAKTKAYARKTTFPDGALVFFCIDSCGAWNKDMVKHFMEARQDLARRSSRTRLISPYNTQQERTRQEWRWSLEQVSLGICRANDEYFLVARTGRLTTNGLTRVQNDEKVQKLKADKAKKNKEERESDTSL